MIAQQLELPLAENPTWVDTLAAINQSARVVAYHCARGDGPSAMHETRHLAEQIWTLQDAVCQLNAPPPVN